MGFYSDQILPRATDAIMARKQLDPIRARVAADLDGEVLRLQSGRLKRSISEVQQVQSHSQPCRTTLGSRSHRGVRGSNPLSSTDRVLAGQAACSIAL
jgi:hypothetical protein